MSRKRKLSQSTYARRVAGGMAAVACALAATLPAVLPVASAHSAPAAHGADRWCLAVLDHPGRFTRAVALDVNDRGLVVGYVVRGDGSDQAAVWWRGRFRTLPDAGATDSVATAVNDRGVVVGTADSSRALLWRRGHVTTLPGFDGNDARANDINNRGVVVGRSQDSSSNDIPVYWRHGQVRQLPTPDGAGGTEVSGVSDSGYMVGADEVFAYGWHRGDLIDLNFLENFEFGLASKVNNKGVAVGQADDGSTYAVPVVWRKGQPTVLRFPRNVAEAAWASDINNRGVIVGSLDMSEVSDRAVAWVKGRLHRLPDGPGDQDAYATAVSDPGLIIGRVGDSAALWRPAAPAGCAGRH